MKKIKLEDLQPGNLIRAHIVPFVKISHSNGRYFLIANAKDWVANVICDVTLTVGRILNKNGVIQLDTAEYGKIDTWVDTIKSVKCYTAEQAHKLLHSKKP